MAKNVRNTIFDYEGKSPVGRSPVGGYENRRDLLDVEPPAIDDFYGPITSRQYRFYKRWMDVGVVLLTGPLLLVLFAIVAAIVRFSSKGSIFYQHQRIGRHGATFAMYKFRTMKVDADQILLNHLLTNPAARQEWMQKHKLRQDPRLTPCGRFLRTTSLDELPQIWNILRGEMSLVGPRPIIWAEKEKYGDRFRFYTAVVPGLTGLWQVSGRCNITYPIRVRLDEQYVREWSLGKDLRILLKTPMTVLSREGAY